MALPFAILAAGWLARPRDVPLQPDRHLWVSLTMALNQELCGTSNLHVATPDVVLDLASAVHKQPGLVKRPLRDVAAGPAAAANAYCAPMTAPYLNNENSLMWLLRAGLIINPSATLEWLGQWLFALKLLCAALFVAGCAALRLNVFAIAASVVIVLAVLAQLKTTYFYSVYSFLFVGLLAYIGGWFALTRLLTSGRPAVYSAGGAAVGFLGAFVVNLRTSYTPIVAIVAACAVMLGVRLWKEDPGTVRRRLALVVAALAVGYGAFDIALIRPLVPREPLAIPNMGHHVVSHPVVLGLALPPNALAQREGIVWDDAVGRQLAARINPGAEYLTEDYEDALWSYYFRLWRQYPSEMFGIYALKAEHAGRDAIRAATRFESSAWMFRAALLPFHALTDGRLLFGVYAVLFVSCGIVSWRTRSVTFSAATILALVLVLLQLEATLIVPEFALKLHTPMIGFAAILGCWVMAVAAAATMRWLPSPGTDLRIEAAAAAGLVVVTGLVARTIAGEPVEEQWSAVVVPGALAAVVYTVFARLVGYRWSVAFVALLIVAVSLGVGAVRFDDAARFRSATPFGEQPPVTAPIVNLLPDPRSWTFAASNVQFTPNEGLVIRGQAESPYGYLIASKAISLKGGDFVVARGTLYEGGVTLGLQRSGQWATVVNVATAGKFSAAVRAPVAGEYQIVVANALSEDQLTNTATISEIGIAH